MRLYAQELSNNYRHTITFRSSHSRQSPGYARASAGTMRARPRVYLLFHPRRDFSPLLGSIPRWNASKRAL